MIAFFVSGLLVGLILAFVLGCHLMAGLERAEWKVRAYQKALGPSQFNPAIWAAEIGGDVAVMQQYLIRYLSDGLVVWHADERRPLSQPYPYAAVLVDNVVEVQRDPYLRAQVVDLIRRELASGLKVRRPGAGDIDWTRWGPSDARELVFEGIPYTVYPGAGA